MKVLLCHPGASWSTADVEAGLRYGLQKHGVQIVRYRLDQRIDRARSWLFYNWKRAKKEFPDIEKPSTADWVYQAGLGALEMALRHQVDVVLVVSAMVLHIDVITMMKRAGLRVVVLFTESPYDIEQELKVARLVDGGWTNERSSVNEFLRVNPNMGYLPHGWHPERHFVAAKLQDRALITHDVVFVGSAWPERVEFFNAINWAGIDLGLYGEWKKVGLKPEVEQCICGPQMENAQTAALYRRARIGLNLYRVSIGWGTKAPRITHAESLSPRAYELAACGAFSISDYRAEVPEVFGDLVPTFRTPSEADALIRAWLPKADERARVAAALPACVADSSWVERASRVIGDLQTLLARRAA